MRSNRELLTLAEERCGAEMAEILLDELAEKAQRLHDKSPTVSQASAFGHAHNVIMRMSGAAQGISDALHAEAGALSERRRVRERLGLDPLDTREDTDPPPCKVCGTPTVAPDGLCCVVCARVAEEGGDPTP